MPGHCGHHVVDVLSNGPHVLDLDIANAARATIARRTARTRLALQETGKLLEVARWPSIAVTIKARDSILDVGCVADLAHLAVANDVYAELNLPGDDVVDRITDDLCRVADCLAFFLREDGIGYGLRARQATDMRCKDSIFTDNHVYSCERYCAKSLLSSSVTMSGCSNDDKWPQFSMIRRRAFGIFPAINLW